MVESLDVVLLMENNILLFLISEITGQVDFWTEQADHKGRLDIICDEDIVPQWNDHRQFAPQPDIGDNTVKSLQEEYAKLLAEKRRRMPNTAPPVTRCASCCSTSRTWIVCWARMSAARKRNRSMIASNGHAPKAFRRNAQPRILRVQGVLGALPLTSRGQFSRRRKLPEKQSGYLFALLATFSPVLRSDASCAPLHR